MGSNVAASEISLATVRLSSRNAFYCKKIRYEARLLLHCIQVEIQLKHVHAWFTEQA